MYNNSDELVHKLNAVESTSAVEFYTVVDTSRSPVHNIPCPLHLVRDKYCDIVWGNCGKTLRDKLQKLQNRGARLLTFSSYDADATELLEFLGWKNLARQQDIHKATIVFRCLHGLAPEYLYSKFTWRDSAYDLRDSENKLNIPLPRSNYYRESFS